MKTKHFALSDLSGFLGDVAVDFLLLGYDSASLSNRSPAFLDKAAVSKLQEPISQRSGVI
jgi:hypothetical protein